VVIEVLDGIVSGIAGETRVRLVSKALAGSWLV